MSELTNASRTAITLMTRVIYKTNFTDKSDNFPMRVIYKTNFTDKCDKQN